MYVVGTHEKYLNEALLMSNHNIFLWRNKENICLIPTLIQIYDHIYPKYWNILIPCYTCSKVCTTYFDYLLVKTIG